MLQILANDDPNGTVGKPAVVRSGLGSVLFHLAVLSVLLYLQFTPAVLPARFARIALVAPVPPPPPPPPALVKPARVTVTRPARAFSPVLTAPAAIPQHAAQIVALAEEPPSIDAAEGVIGGVPGGIPGGIPGGVLGAPIPAILPPPPPAPVVQVRAPEPAAEPAKPARIHVDSQIQEAMLLTMVEPVYPEMAKLARIQGDVHLHAVIDRTGKITDLQVLSGNPLLVPAARSAVIRWRYRPTMLHGEAVEVTTDIVVRFHLRPVG